MLADDVLAVDRYDIRDGDGEWVTVADSFCGLGGAALFAVDAVAPLKAEQLTARPP
jgi:hypothetical protein